MTRRHFQALADALRYSMPHTGRESEHYAQWVTDVRGVGDACYAANGRFDRARFERACGMDGE